jgi:hypothetical protein
MLTAKGTNGTIHFDGQTVTIERTGFNARVFVGGGEKRIPITSITAVQWKKAGLTAGFIQFTVPGGNEVRSRSGRQSRDALHDENSVTFHARQMPAFEPIRAAIEQAIAARHNAPQAAPAAAASIGDELAKLAALREQGIITDADFEAGKARILRG